MVELDRGVFEVHAMRLAPDSNGRAGRLLVSHDLTDRIAQDERQIHQERLAVLGALLVLIGVSFAAEDALAVENADVTTTAVAIHSAADNTIKIAEQANEEAAAKAIEALAKENGQDLDIRLDAHRTMLFAGRK